MRQILYIRLQSAEPDADTAYCLAGSDAALSFKVEHAPLSQVLALAEGHRIIVLVPGASVRLTRISVPARQPAKVLQAAPYALEEQMAEDVDTLHFALGPRQADLSFPIAVVTRALMEQWLTPFRERGLRPEALIPETLCLPVTRPGQWSALAEPGHITVRTDEFSGFGCISDDLPLFLEMADPDRKNTLRMIVPQGVNDDFTRLQWPLELLPGFHDPLAALLQNLPAERSLNLLQGSYSQREDLRRLWLPWRAAAILAGAWIVLATAQHVIQATRLKHEIAALEQQNVQRYQAMFPSETRIVDLQAQAEQQMKSLQGGSHGGLLPLMETLSQALSATKGLTLQAVQYREGSLYVSLTGTDLQQLETLRAWFSKNPTTRMDVQSANSGSDGAQIRIKLTPA
ncbi:MAG TPA: type II secretion system protein GspL [Stenotrophobium sp.]|nr:type II secretion system protein GspL [Stenotrophobium sp.]